MKVEETRRPGRADLLISGLVMNVVMVGLAAAGGWAFGVPWVDAARPTWWGAGVGLSVGAPLFGIIWWVVHTPLLEGLASRRQLNEDLRNVFVMMVPLGVGGRLVLAVGAGLSEELLFRGVVEAGVDSWLGGGALVAALLFGLAHPISKVYVVYIAGVGLVFSAAMAGGGLFAAIVGHAVFDALALTIGRNSPVVGAR